MAIIKTYSNTVYNKHNTNDKIQHDNNNNDNITQYNNI